MNTKFSRAISQVNWVLVILPLLIAASGLVVLRSAGYVPELSMSPPFRRQLISLGLGMSAFLVAAVVKPGVWRRWAYPVYGLCCLMLLAVLLTGSVAGGARRWLMIGSIRIQPSELMKIGLILALARLFSGSGVPRKGYRLLQLFWPAVLIGLPVILILAEPDLGTALCHILIGGSMLFLAGIERRTLLRLCLIAVIAAPVSWSFLLKGYQKQRVLTFLSPESDPLGSGYHAIQSKIAVGSGAIFGKGYHEGTQTQLSFLPEQTTDFIFSVLAEEWGLAGSLLVISLYALLLLHLLGIAAQSEDRFSAFLSFGMAALVFWHTVINIGMVVGVLPVVGLTLSLFSFGGSSMVTVFAGLGMVLGASSRKFFFR